MASVKLQNVCKNYNSKQDILKNINLEIKDREFMVFVGPSGCGKSTTLRIIAGLEDITSGELYIDDILSNNISSSKRDIAMVFQNYALYPHMNVAQNLGFALKMAKVDKKQIEQKVQKVAKMLGLSEYLKEKPKSLSGGQKQRVALGRAMVREPKVFLLDEPLSNLDSKLRVSTRSEIVNFHKKLNTTFIYVTHDQIEAMTMGTRIAVLNKGNIEQVATPNKLYQNPTNTFVAQFIGSPKMNIFNATLVKLENRYFVEFKGYKKELPEHFKLIDSLDFKNGVVEILLGIRAENLHIATKKEFDFYFDTTIFATEDIGSDIFIYFYEDNVKMVARVSNTLDFKQQDRFSFGFSIKNTHLFSKKSKKTIINKEI